MDFSPEDEIRELRRKIQILNVVIEEGDVVNGGLQSEFWKVIKRTILSLQESYKVEVYDAVKLKSKNIGPFIGRMEMIDHLIQIMEGNFIQGSEKALLERETCLKRLQELHDILDKKPNVGYTGASGEV
jgi:hypothetical protein